MVLCKVIGIKKPALITSWLNSLLNNFIIIPIDGCFEFQSWGEAMTTLKEIPSPRYGVALWYVARA